MKAVQSELLKKVLKDKQATLELNTLLDNMRHLEKYEYAPRLFKFEGYLYLVKRVM